VGGQRRRRIEAIEAVKLARAMSPIALLIVSARCVALFGAPFFKREMNRRRR
jgi:hypothetical protein